MKKTLAAAIILTLCLTGCQGLQQDSVSENQGSGQTGTDTQELPNVPDSLADKVDSYVNAGGMPNSLDSSGTTSEEEQGSTDSDDTQTQTDDEILDFETRDDKVYAITNVTVRNKPSTSGDPVMNLKKGKGVHRVGYNEAWTKVEINGYFYYIASRYLSEKVE